MRVTFLILADPIMPDFNWDFDPPSKIHPSGARRRGRVGSGVGGGREARLHVTLTAFHKHEIPPRTEVSGHKGSLS